MTSRGHCRLAIGHRVAEAALCRVLQGTEEYIAEMFQKCHLLSKLKRRHSVNQCAGHSVLDPWRLSEGPKLRPISASYMTPAPQLHRLGLLLSLPALHLPPSSTNSHLSDSSWIWSSVLPPTCHLCPQNTCPSLHGTLPIVCSNDPCRGYPPLNQEFLKDRVLLT